MTSLTQMAYGSRERLHGKSRLLFSYQPSSCRWMRATRRLLPSADGIDGPFPVLSVERTHAEAREHVAVEAAHVHVDRVRMRARCIKRLHTAVSAEAVLGDPRVELV